MVEIAGIPRKDNENALDLVANLAVTAKVNDFEKAQICVAHKTSNKANAPIIVMFNNNFYKQKKKLISVKSKDIVVMNDDSDSRDDEEVTLPGLNKDLIFVNESLTHMNRTLLKGAKAISKNLHYKYTGYTFNGEVRVKKSENSEHNLLLVKRTWKR